MKRFLWVLKFRVWFFLSYGENKFSWKETGKAYDEKISSINL